MAVPKKNSVQPQRHRLHFLIIGAGICGLSAAIALRRVGHKVTVIDKDLTLDKGASGGCRIAPNLHKILVSWGLEADLKEIASKSETINMLSYKTGEYLGSIQWNRDILKETRGEFGMTSYPALRALLYRHAISLGALIRFGAKAVCLNVFSDSPSVTLDCGDSIHADILIGADGVHGVTRKYVVASTDAPTGLFDNENWSRKDIKSNNEGMRSREEKNEASAEAKEEEEEGLNMFSVSIPKKSILNDPKLEYLINRRDNAMFVWLGHEYSAVGFPSGESSDFSLCVYGPISTDKDLRFILRGAEPRLSRLASSSSDLGSTPACAPLAHEHVLDQWVQGSLVVIGEAAHPLPPGSMQSCALSVEDGAVLAKLFAFQLSDGGPLSPHIPTLLAAFQSIRHPRCASMQIKEVGIAHYMTMPGDSGAERDMRDQGMRARRDTIGITVVPIQVTTPMDMYFGADYDEDEQDSEGTSPEWAEIEAFAYEAEEEAEEWWCSWGRFQIGRGTWPKTRTCAGSGDGVKVSETDLEAGLGANVFNFASASGLSASHSVTSLLSYPSLSLSSHSSYIPTSSMDKGNLDPASLAEFSWNHSKTNKRGELCSFLV